MGVTYRAHIFVGCEVNDEFFYELGSKSAYKCLRHGPQPDRFCGSCGTLCIAEAQKKWKAPMRAAADVAKKTPEQLWEIWCPEGGFASQTDKGKFGRWAFGYDNDRVLWGTVVASHWDEDARGGSLTFPELETAVNAVNIELSKFGAPDYARIHCILDA